MKSLSHIQLIFTALFLLSSSFNALADTLSASVDRSSIAIDETLRLSLRYSGQQVSEEPNLSLLDKDFEVLSTSKNNQYRMMNGRSESFTTWHVSLAPRREGNLLIPSFTLNQEFSDALSITVSDNPSTGSIQGKEVFVKAHLEKSQAYIQEQVILTLQLFTKVDLNNLQMGELNISNASVKELGQQQFQKNISGVDYQILQVSFAIFPEQAGELKIPAVTFSATSASRRALYDPWNRNRNNQQGRTYRPRSKAQTLQVLDAEPSVSPWLPAKKLDIKQQWSGNLNNISTGQPITRTITIKVNGLESSLIPPLAQASIPGLKSYPDQAQLNDDNDAQGINGSRIESTAWIATRPGSYTLPPVEIVWWNTQTSTLEKAVLAEQTFTVIASAQESREKNNAANVPPPPSDISSTDPSDLNSSNLNQNNSQSSHKQQTWLRYGLILSVITNLIITLLWLTTRQRLKSRERYEKNNKQKIKTEPQHKSAAKNIEQAARDGNAIAFRTALLSWAKLYWDKQNIQGLIDLPLTPELKLQLKAFDAELYSGNELAASQDLRQLWRSIKQQAAGSLHSKKRSDKFNELTPLYPPS